MIPKFSVKKPFTVFVAVILVIVLGIVTYGRMTPDLLPDMNMPYVVLLTTYPGASPEKVEEEVTKPVEKSMAALSGLDSVSSTSAENYSMVMLRFSGSVNMDAATMKISEKLNDLRGSFADGVGSTTVLQLDPNIIPTAVVAVLYEGKDKLALSSFVDETLLTELEGVDGVAAITETGSVKQKVEITLSPEKIAAVNEELGDAIRAKFDEAMGELDEARSELAEGEAALAENREKLEAGQSSLNRGKKQANAELTAAQEALDAKYDELSGLYDSLTAQRASLSAKLSEALTLKQTLTKLKYTVKALETAERVFDATITAIENDPLLTEEEKTERIAAVKATEAYTTLLNSLAAIDAQLAEQGLTRDDIDATLAKLDDGIAQMNDGIDQIDAALPAIEEGLAAIEDGYTQLADKKSDVSAQLAAAQSKLNAGKSALETAQTQLDEGETKLTDAETLADEQLSSALSQADLNGKLTLEVVATLLGAQNFSMPAGYVQNGDESWPVSVGDELGSVEELSALVLVDSGLDDVGAITLSDVADIAVTDNSATTYARIDGSDGLLLSFTKQSSYATADVANNIQSRLTELSSEYEGLSFVSLMDQGDYIDMALGTVMENLLIGAALAILILLLFLRDIRPTFIVACSIPISVLFAIVMMYFCGVSLNLFSLAGLAIGVGMLVDNSIVVIENTYRLRSEGVPVKEAAVEGAKSVAGAITASTLTTVCVFAPILFVEGLTRQLFTDLILTIAFSLMASLIVALTFIPAIVTGMLRRPVKPQKERTKRLFDRFERVTEWTLSHRIVCLLVALVLLAGTTWASLAQGFSYLPESGGTQISVSVTLPEDMDFTDKTAVADDILARLDTVDGMGHVGAMLSSGGVASVVGLSMGDSEGGGNELTAYALLDESSGRSSTEVSGEIKTLLSDYNELYGVTVAGMSTMDYSSVFSGGGVSVTLYGNDLGELTEAAKAVGAAIGGAEGIDSVDDGTQDAAPALHITVDKAAAMQHNLTTAQVYLAVATKLTDSVTVSTLDTADGSLSLQLISGAAKELTMDDLYELTVSATKSDGTSEDVPLKDIATFAETTTLTAISRVDQRRCISVSATLKDGYNVTKVTSAAKSAVDAVQLPSSVRVSFDGENETILSSLSDLVFMLLLGILIIYLIMVAQFQSLLSPFIVLFTIPLAFTGGFAALLITGTTVSIVAMIGFIMLVGVVVNNGIVLIDCINQLRAEGMDKRKAILTSVRMRLRPVLMTATTTILGLLPLAMGFGVGAEMIQPVAIVCVGGLIYATITTLLLIPLLYDLFHPERKKKKAEADRDGQAVPAEIVPAATASLPTANDDGQTGGGVDTPGQPA